MPHLEIEFKTLLTQDEYQQLLPEFAGAQAFEQTNHYIDTPDKALKNKKMSLRIRRLSTRAELTFKLPQPIGHLELNQDLSLDRTTQLLETFELPAGHIRDELISAAIAIDSLEIWGHLRTIRYEMKQEIGLLALDESFYNDQHDYELEIEVNEAETGQVAFQDYLKAHGISYKDVPSKVARCAGSQ